MRNCDSAGLSSSYIRSFLCNVELSSLFNNYSILISPPSQSILSLCYMVLAGPHVNTLTGHLHCLHVSQGYVSFPHHLVLYLRRQDCHSNNSQVGDTYKYCYPREVRSGAAAGSCYKLYLSWMLLAASEVRWRLDPVRRELIHLLCKEACMLSVVLGLSNAMIRLLNTGRHLYVQVFSEPHRHYPSEW